MFWRAAPPGLKHSVEGKQPDWPRNGAVLRGVVHELPEKHDDNKLWLEVVAFQQAGAEGFEPAPGCWMQFEQGGLLLHKVE